MTGNPRLSETQQKRAVHRSLEEWPDAAARRALVSICSVKDLARLRTAGYALARCGNGRRAASEEFLDRYQNDRRIGLRTAVLYARMFQLEDDPRGFLREVRRVANHPGGRPWPAIMDGLNHMWARNPRDMYRLMPAWLTHRDPHRRWAALHGLEIPARKEPHSALKVLRLLRGERDLRVRRLLGHVVGQELYLRHPEPSMQEMARWLGNGARSAQAITRQIERQVEIWFASGLGSERQRVRLLRVAREYEDHRHSRVRTHARRIVRIVEA